VKKGNEIKTKCIFRAFLRISASVTGGHFPTLQMVLDVAEKNIVFNGLFRYTVSHNVKGNNFTSKTFQIV